MRLLVDSMSWESVRTITRFTAARCEAQKQHAALADPLRELLARWSDIERERVEADDALVDANALVSAVDVELDDCVVELDTRVLYENGGNANSPVYKEYFPEPTHTVTRMGLQTEIARTRKFAHVAEERGASKEVQAILKKMGQIERRGEAALSAREEAKASVQRVSLRMGTWRDDANIARRKVETALNEYAVQHKLPRSYASSFFPLFSRPAKQATAPKAPSSPPAPA